MPHNTGEYWGAANSVWKLKYSNIVYLKKLIMVFHNGSNYGYHFIIKKVAENIEGQLTCLGENTEE